MHTYALFASIFLFCNLEGIDRKLHLQCLYPTVLMKPASKENPAGTGIIVRSDKVSENEYLNIVLTAAHVADSCNTTRVFNYEDWGIYRKTNDYLTIFYAQNNDRDIAVGIFTSERKMPIAKINMNMKVYIGSDVFHVGCGMGDDPRLDYGKITSLHGKLNDDKYWSFRTSTHTIPGDSGGALFRKYQVIGICRYIRNLNGLPVFNISYYVPINNLRDWSEEKNGAYDFVWKDKPIPKIPAWSSHFLYHYDYTTD